MKLIDCKRPILFLLAGMLTLALSLRVAAEDIDIFVGSSSGGDSANVLIILDNTSNFSKDAQHWPGGLVQGQSEVQALSTVIGNLSKADDDNGPNINIGLMMFNQNGLGACCSGGFIRYAMQSMKYKTNRDDLKAVLKDINDNITDPKNKAASNASYSMSLFDAFKYFGGYTSPKHALDDVQGAPTGPLQFGPDVFATPPDTFNKPDALGYTNSYTVYASPAPAAGACGGKNYILFVGNTFPNSDTSSPQENMATLLKGVNDNTIPSQLKLNTFTTTTTTASTNLGFSSACYNGNASGLSKCSADNANTCGTSYDTCTCSAPTTGTGCSGSNVKYTIFGAVTTTNVKPTATTCTPGAPGCGPLRYADEWAQFLYNTDVNSAAGQQNVTMFTVDVFNAKQDADQTALLYNMACYAGGCGNYYVAKNQNQLVIDFGEIFSKIMALDSAFAAASLPISASNRTLNANEVYIGMFRPDANANPVWYGNLKRYQIANFNGDYQLADVSKQPAVNPLTGFVDDCRTSYWTNNSGKYWANVSTNPSPAGLCPPANTTYDVFSDAPDGPKVEKGSVSEVLRRGNSPPATNTSPTWALNRNVYTKGFVPFDTANTAMPAIDVDFIRGLNIDPNGNSVTYTFTDASGASTSTSIRPTIHGDIVHSRPQPVSYGGSTGTMIYYGANDGTLRAVAAATGSELWAYVAPEFYSTLSRLRKNKPPIKYSSFNNASATPKDYYFDGSMGLYQNLDNSKVWIYPTMRRGGRMIYALDVHIPTSPALLWKAGCPNLNDNIGCSANMSSIGQTWSTPSVATLKTGGTVGETASPVVVVGGGYDNCEDGAAAAPCGANGSIVYVLNAADGTVLQSFTTTGRVPSDVALVDVDHDGIPDFAYVGDTRGNLYRISFGLSKSAPLKSGNWTVTRIAYTNDTSNPRKFLYAPAIVSAFDSAAGQNAIYVALGTGDREQPLITHYPYTTPILNRFYVFMDSLTAATAANLDDTAVMCDFTSSGTCDTATPQTDACGNTVVIPGSGKLGWFMDLDVCGPDAPDGCTKGSKVIGEQTVTSAAIVGGVVAFSTNRAIPPKPNVCAPQGDARGYLVNVFSGSGAICTSDQTCVCGGERSGDFVGGGLPPSPVIATVNVDGVVQTILIGAADKKGGRSSGIQSQVGFSLSPQRRTRMYWRTEGDN